jgi:hypothetical protein
MGKLVIFLMTCIIIGFQQVNCIVFNYIEFVRSINMCNSTFITEVALVKVMCHNSVICHAFITNCRKLKSIKVTFYGTVSISGVLTIAEVTKNLKKKKHTHTQTHTYMYRHTHTCTHHLLPSSAL